MFQVFFRPLPPYTHSTKRRKAFKSMKMPNSSFSIGNIPIPTKDLDKKGLQHLKKSIESSGIESKKVTAEECAGIVDSWIEEGSVSFDDFNKLTRLQWDGRNGNKALKRQYWDQRNSGADWKDLKPLETEMGLKGDYISRVENLKNAYRESTARVAVQAAAAGTFSGPATLVAAYIAWADKEVRDQETAAENLLGTYQEFLQGDSRMETEGNKVEQVHREHLWPAIHSTLDSAITAAEAGNPTEVDLQYYELTSPEVIGKAAKAAEVGNKVRVNIDPGRLSYPETGEDKVKVFAIDDIPHKMRTAIQLSKAPGDIGVSIFAVKKLLEDPEDLMHRKVVRAGDTVLLSGMNANMGSGENIDAGYLIQGPAAHDLTANVHRDMRESIGAGVEEIWGEEHFKGFTEEVLSTGRRGITAMLDVLAGTSPAGEALPNPKNLKELDKLGKAAGVDVRDWIETDGDVDKELTAMLGGKSLRLSAEGKKALVSVLEAGIAATQEKSNVKSAQDLTLPSDKAAGKTEIDVADLAPEREALMLQAVAEAEEFIYIPGFVMTRAVAAAIVARRDELAAQGKEIDVKIMVDPGIYPDGSTPNKWGVGFLEDHGITPRWAMLPRTGHHDRKIHAKQLITDKGEIMGSTNFSKKGMRDNWETSAYVHFDESDEGAQAAKEQAVGQFMDLWNNQSFELNTKDLAGMWNKYKPKVGKDWFIDDSRGVDFYSSRGALVKIIQALETYEEQTGELISGMVESDKKVQDRIADLREQGYAEGYAAVKAVRDTLGDEAYTEKLESLDGYKALHKMQDEVAQWKREKAEWVAKQRAKKAS